MSSFFPPFDKLQRFAKSDRSGDWAGHVLIDWSWLTSQCSSGFIGGKTIITVEEHCQSRRKQTFLWGLDILCIRCNDDLSSSTFHMEHNTPTCWSLQVLDGQVLGKAEKWTHQRRSPCSNPLWSSYPYDSLALLCFSFMHFLQFIAITVNHKSFFCPLLVCQLSVSKVCSLSFVLMTHCLMHGAPTLTVYLCQLSQNSFQLLWHGLFFISNYSWCTLLLPSSWSYYERTFRIT